MGNAVSLLENLSNSSIDRNSSSAASGEIFWSGFAWDCGGAGFVCGFAWADGSVVGRLCAAGVWAMARPAHIARMAARMRRHLRFFRLNFCKLTFQAYV